MNAYEEGEKAFHNDKKLSENPYPPTDPDSGKWESGYIDADIMESGEIS